MDKNLDTLLASDLLDIPGDFTQRVMQRIHNAPKTSGYRSGFLEKLQSFALISGGIVGLSQLVAFMFGIWTATAVG